MKSGDPVPSGCRENVFSMFVSLFFGSCRCIRKTTSVPVSPVSTVETRRSRLCFPRLEDVRSRFRSAAALLLRFPHAHTRWPAKPSALTESTGIVKMLSFVSSRRGGVFQNWTFLVQFALPVDVVHNRRDGRVQTEFCLLSHSLCLTLHFKNNQILSNI